MNGNVFECHDEQTDRRQFAKTLDALQGYAKKNLKFYEDLKRLFATTMVAPNIDRPVLPKKMDETDEAIWKEELKEYV
jgi:hypothetical protein